MLFFTTIGVGAASAQYYQGRLSIPGGGSSDMTGSRMKVNATNNGKMSGVTSTGLVLMEEFVTVMEILLRDRDKN